MAEIGQRVTSYVARHTWATIAKKSGIPVSVISEGLGHSDEKTTNIYLDSFKDGTVDRANEIVTDLYSDNEYRFICNKETFRGGDGDE